MQLLTSLETMFVEEFCRFQGIPLTEVARLGIESRRKNPAGFVSKVIASTVPPSLSWGERFFRPERVAVVGPEGSHGLALLVFDEEAGKLESIEGDFLGFEWSIKEEPAYWSEADRDMNLRPKG